MANIEKLMFPALKITGANYMAWTTDVELYLEMEKISDTIKKEIESPAHEKAKAIIFLRKHVDENVRHDYANIKDPAELWATLKERFDNQKDINLPHALEEWKNLRFQDFEKVEDYNSAILRIVAQLKYCGKPVTEAEMLEKTYLTFHKEHRVLQEMYRSREYKRFSELMVTLILAEKNSELLIRNHNSRPTGTKASPEVNAADVRNPERNSQTYRGRGRGRGRGRRFNRGRGRNYNPQGRDYNPQGSDYNHQKNNYNPQGRKSFKWVRPEQSQKGKELKESSSQNKDGCFRCGSRGHWSQVCRTPPHLCKLYQESLKGKGKEVNLMEHFEGTTYLDSSDFENDFDETTLTGN